MSSTALDRIDGLSTSVALKAPCRVATTANITLSGLQTIGSVTVADGDRVLVKDQSNAVENGIYVARATAWTRALDFNGARDVVKGTAVRLADGSVTSSNTWVVTSDNPITIGTSAINWRLTTLTASSPVRYESFVAAYSADLSAVDSVDIVSHPGSWANTTTGPKGRTTFHKDGTTGTASTAYPGNIGFYDVNGKGFSLSVPDGRLSVYAVGVAAGVDATAQIQAAIDLLAVSGGTLYGDGAFDITCESALDLKSNVTLQDIDFIADLGTNPDYFIQGTGTQGTSTSVTANVSAGDTTVTVSSTTGFSVGGYALLIDTTRLTGRWPYTVFEIDAIAGSNITAVDAIPLPYLTANTCTLTPITPIVNAHLKNINISYASSSTSKFAIDFQNAVDCTVDTVTIKDHAYTSNPTACVSVNSDVTLRYDCRNISVSQNSNTVGGNALLAYGGTQTAIGKIRSTSCNFGVGLWLSVGASVTGCQLVGKRASGNRGIKIAGCQLCSAVDNAIQYFDSGFKIEDTGQYDITSNTLLNNGFSTSSHGINISSVNAASAADTRLGTVTSNKVYNQNGSGIFLDVYGRDCVVSSNIIREPSQQGILSTAVDVTISDNFVFEFGAGAGIEFEPGSVVTGNKVTTLSGSLGSFELGTQPSDTDFTVFTNNSSGSNAVVTNAAYFRKVAVCNGNAILNFGNRIMFGDAAPTSGAFTRGDRVYDDSPSASGFIGWVCTGSGTPGTWVTFGVTSA